MSSIRFASCAGILLASLGCGKNDNPGTQATKPARGVAQTETTALSIPSAGSTPAPALQSAKDFLKAVQEGKATSASLTTAFKKVIAPPELDADKAAGYSESGVQAWLGRAKTRIGTHDLKVGYATADFALASAEYRTEFKARGLPGTTYLRLVRSGTAWAIDHAIIGTKDTKFPLPANDQAPRTFAAIAFAEALMAKDMVALENLLSKSAKAKLAPPLFDIDKEQGYSKSNLKSAVEKMYPSMPVFTGLDAGGEAIKVDFNLNGAIKNLILKLIAGTSPGEFLIDDYQQK